VVGRKEIYRTPTNRQQTKHGLPPNQKSSMSLVRAPLSSAKENFNPLYFFPVFFFVLRFGIDGGLVFQITPFNLKSGILRLNNPNFPSLSFSFNNFYFWDHSI